MKKIDLGQSLAILANVGVIAGIVFLAIELAQNNEMMQSQTRHEISQSIIENAMFLASDEDLHDIWWRGANGQELQAAERDRFNEAATALIRMWENIHYQSRRGLFDPSELEGELGVWRVVAGTEWFRLYWCQSGFIYSRAFREEIEAMMPATECTESEATPFMDRP